MALTFTYEGTSSLSYIDIILNVDKTLTPASETREIYIPNKEGVYFFDRNFNKRIIDMKVLIKGTTEADLIAKLNNLNGFLFKNTAKQLIFSNESDKHFNALLANRTQSIDKSFLYATIDLSFHCFDPFAYTTTLTQSNQNCTTKPSTIPVNNQGNYYAYPNWIITFTQAQTYIKFATEGDNNIMNITRTFAINDKLKINTKDRIISYDSGAGYSENWTGVGIGGEERADFIRLGIGNYNYTINTSDSTLNVNVAWEFNKTWL